MMLSEAYRKYSKNSFFKETVYGKGAKMKPSDIITIISAICGSGMISVFLSHILYNKKLSKEIHYKGKEKIAENIYPVIMNNA